MLGVRRFVDTVNVVLMKLQHRGFTLNRFSVAFELWKEHARHIDGWVSFAVASKAKVVSLDFSLYQGSFENSCSFPFHLFNDQNASCIRVLHLGRVNLVPPTPDDICVFANLTAVSLERAVTLQDLHHFLSKCPALEWLTIRECSQRNTSLHAAEPSARLKFLYVQDSGFDKIELRAPNLTTFGYRGCSKVLVALHESLMLKTSSFQSRVEENLGRL
ncbi:hypothetical protein PR202_gb15307 [Eleusine coracana subsp. coracana]|uniref:At1g61320/AtMIF1 LRR domain-containing protein n=1 Tax=Eleusine coracana subsp. coracana TaxID=191504 RepID=A0AAV5EVA1_ELECO|nr:hypothetical protein PR202_gb15307 [Eleusine coracana subsp. coracana]